MQIDVISLYPPEKQTHMRRDLLELIDSDLDYLRTNAPNEYKRWFHEMLIKSLLTLNIEQFSKIFQTLTVEQLEAMIQRKEAQERAAREPA